MRYYIYENWRAEKKCVIHCGTCSMCNDGQGIHAGSSTKFGCWHGPFDSFEEALAFAKAKSNRVTKCCKICAPETEGAQ